MALKMKLRGVYLNPLNAHGADRFSIQNASLVAIGFGRDPDPSSATSRDFHLNFPKPMIALWKVLDPAGRRQAKLRATPHQRPSGCGYWA
jgi:hypothetical protein